MMENSMQTFMLKEGSHCICLSVVLAFFAFKMGKNCYP